MGLKLEYYKLTLQFKFEAGTSRGVLTQKDCFILKVYDPSNPSKYGLGECAPLEGLSVETVEQVQSDLHDIASQIEAIDIPGIDDIPGFVTSLTDLSSLRFGLEMALYDLINGGKRMIFNNPFSRGVQAIPINGLVWMGNKAFMRQQIDEKIAAGFECIKLKIGALDFEQELELLTYIRSEYAKNDLTLRVDANGAFDPAEALQKLQALSQFDIHSIEQPIKVGQREQMNQLCKVSPIDIALDEELISIDNSEMKASLLDDIRPQYIILKPSLMGGIHSTKEWIELAEQRRIGWWMTSALESNIGLNAIAQLTAEYPVKIPQGLGTGQLYHNNIDSPLTISQGHLQYDLNKYWNYSQLDGLA